MLPLNPSSLSSSSLTNHHRKSFRPAKVFRPAPPTTWKAADEMIGVPVPRKARSASTKRSHECWASSGGGIMVEQNHRQPSSSPVRAATAPPSPSSSNASKPNGRNKEKMKWRGRNGGLRQNVAFSDELKQNLYTEYVRGSTGEDDHRQNVICNSWPDGMCPAMEMSLPSSSYTPVENPLKSHLFGLPWKYPFELLKMDMNSSDIMILKSLHKDMLAAMNLVALGVSTDALDFVIAIAKCFGIVLTLDDFRKAVEDVHKEIEVKPNHIEKKARINRAPLRSVAKITGKERLDSFGTSFVFKGEEALCDSVSEDPSSFKEMIKPEEDHARKEAHIDLALQGSVPKPTGKEWQNFFGELSCAVFWEL